MVAEGDPFLTPLHPSKEARKSIRGGCISCGQLCACCLCVSFCVFVLMAAVLYFSYQRVFIGPSFHDDDIDRFRPKAAVQAEAKRRSHAEGGGQLRSLRDLPDLYSLGQVQAAGYQFNFFNFVQGFEAPGLLNWMSFHFWNILRYNSEWRPPVEGETMGVVSYQEYASKHFHKEFPLEFFSSYYTGSRVPSWEDNTRHKLGMAVINTAMHAARKVGTEPIHMVRPLEPRLAFDNKALMKVAWDGFRYMGPLDIKYASNGVFGVSVVEGLMEKYNATADVLGILMTDSAFSAHLFRKSKNDPLLHIDLTSLEKYHPISGYAAMGGSASFREEGGRLRTVKLTYGGETFETFDSPEVARDFEERSKRSGWRYAEANIITSLLGMTNLVLHVKNLHLEIAAAFQAVTVDAFAGEPKHPVRLLLDPFISRSVQATNDNFQLLYGYLAADFSLAPLPSSEQLKLIDDFIKTQPLILSEMDMENYGKKRHIEESHSTAGAITNSTHWGWRWHYRALTVQRLYDDLVACRLRAHYGVDNDELDKAIAADSVLNAWWKSMIDHLPSLRRATVNTPDWASETITFASLRRVASTLMVWLSWIHEDVGHSAAAYVYNPVYTPMCVPEDGVGVPMRSWTFNALAYRGFVFLHRSVLLGEAPDFWFDGCAGCRKCFETFQSKLKTLGEKDPAFSECDKNGFYSCVGRVETAVSS